MDEVEDQALSVGCVFNRWVLGWFTELVRPGRGYKS
jgi:hypothetical protein